LRLASLSAHVPPAQRARRRAPDGAPLPIRFTSLTSDDGRLAWPASDTSDASGGAPSGAALLRLLDRPGQLHSAELELTVHPADRHHGTGTTAPAPGSWTRPSPPPRPVRPPHRHRRQQPPMRRVNDALGYVPTHSATTHRLDLRAGQEPGSQP
jgi:hypothetical protein